MRYVPDIATALHEAKVASEYQRPRNIKSPVLTPICKVKRLFFLLLHSLDESPNAEIDI